MNWSIFGDLNKEKDYLQNHRWDGSYFKASEKSVITVLGYKEQRKGAVTGIQKWETHGALVTFSLL